MLVWLIICIAIKVFKIPLIRHFLKKIANTEIYFSKATRTTKSILQGQLVARLFLQISVVFKCIIFTFYVYLYTKYLEPIRKLLFMNGNNFSPDNDSTSKMNES